MSRTQQALQSIAIAALWAAALTLQVACAADDGVVPPDAGEGDAAVPPDAGDGDGDVGDGDVGDGDVGDGDGGDGDVGDGDVDDGDGGADPIIYFDRPDAGPPAPCTGRFSGPNCLDCPFNEVDGFWDARAGCASCARGYSGDTCTLCRVHVDGDADRGGDGSSWASALRSLDEGLEAAKDGLFPGATDVCEIVVAGGTYRPTGDDPAATFSLAPKAFIVGPERNAGKGVLRLYGGFAGGESLPSGLLAPDAPELAARDFIAEASVLSGHFPVSDTRVHHVVSGADGAVLDGVTIMGGRAQGEDDEERVGAGLYLHDGSMTLRNLRFEDNLAAEGGDSLYARAAENGDTELLELFMPGADLAGALLTTACAAPDSDDCRIVLQGDIAGASLHGADLAAADLSTLSLTSVRTFELVSCPAVAPAGWLCLLLPQLGSDALIGPGANLGGADLRGTDLASASLVGAVLAGARTADLQGCPPPAELPSPSFQCADQSDSGGTALLGPAVDVRGVGLEGADLGEAALAGAILSGASLAGADLGDADLRGADLRDADLSDADLTDVDARGADLSDATVDTNDVQDLRAFDLAGMCPAELPTDWQCIAQPVQGGRALVGPGADLRDANLREADLGTAELAGANLRGANLRDAALASANLDGVRAYDLAACTDVTLPADWQCLELGPAGNTLVGPGTVLSGVNLQGADFGGANLAGADLAGADLSGADLAGVNLTGADLSGADLTGAGLAGTTLTAAILTGATLDGADLTGASVDDAVLSGASLVGADLEQASLVGAVVDAADFTNATLDAVRAHDLLDCTGVVLPSPWSCRALGSAGSGLVGPAVDLAGVDATGASLAGADLGQADLDGSVLDDADLDGADLTGANLAGADLIDASFVGADLSDADLTGADPTDADLTTATLVGSNLAGVDLSSAALGGVQASGLPVCPSALPPAWSCIQLDSTFALLGPLANAGNLDFGSADLDGVDLRGAALGGSSLDGASLHGLRAYDLPACPDSLPMDWSCLLHNTSLALLIGEGADLSGADLTGTDLSAENVADVDWTGATCPDGTAADDHVDGCASHLSPPPPP